MRFRSRIDGVVRGLNRPRPYRSRHGLARGLTQIGGIRLVLPDLFQAPEYTRYAGLEEGFLRSLELDGKTIYDVGAFEGVVTLFFAQQAGDEGHVVAFEPHPANYQRLVDNVRLNNFTNIITRNVAIGRASGELELAASAGGGLFGRATASDAIKNGFASDGVDVELFTVPLSTLDEEIQTLPLPAPDFVKIDVEGLELDVLEGMKATIAERKPALFVEMHGAGLEAKRANAGRVVGFLAEHGYSMHHVESAQPVGPSISERAFEGHLYCVAND